ncbi:MAG: integrase [Cyanomargarita calcarea GSE-NOS-MK-12-04C]|uniref:Integrase n=1 Tax=Cyanomargarita calcarea GSE-NOS-MK-12-04C TaxID=2839659 RepID=A0A951UV35_9CYAN|nr:integrase [Cyanomargarita calcarea GSE-NOS-MK-12-04C]
MKLTINAINERLKTAKVGVKVEQRGDRLTLRATLPPKPGSAKTKPHQQYLSLKIYANPAGLRQAEAEAKVVGGLLACGRFDWGKYLDEETSPGARKKFPNCAELVEKFKAEYFSQRGDTPQTQLTWKNDYESAFKRLDGDGECTSEALIAAATSTVANTRTRKRNVEKLQALAKFAGVEVDLAPYKGNYGLFSLKTRNIPSDTEIEITLKQLAFNPAWQWVFGVMACYGLRDHEVFFCEVSPIPPHTCRIIEGKTGGRICYPLHPHWATEWKLWTSEKPACTGKTYRDYGQRVGQHFHRHKLPFTPYDLRHAYAIRGSIQYKIPVVAMAAWMGHKPSVHWDTYNRWIKSAEHERVFLEAMPPIHAAIGSSTYPTQTL